MKRSLSLLASVILGGAAWTIPAAAAEEGFESIFDGSSIRGWTGNPRFWSVEDGALTGRTTKENPARNNTFLVWTGQSVGDFVLRLRYRLNPGNEKNWGNSGIQYRSRYLNAATFAVGGYQADIESGPTFSGILYDEGGVAGGRGIMAGRGEKVEWDKDGKKQVTGSLGKSEDLQKAIKPGDWNDYEITAEGYHFVHKINGVTMVDVTDNCEAKRQSAGIIALQLHVGEPMIIQFKDIRIKKLTKKIVLVAGGASHGPGDHEHRAGCLLLKKCLDQIPGVQAVVATNGWPASPEVFQGAVAIAVFSDGGGGHPFIQGDRLRVLGEFMKKGVGLGLIHYGVEVPKDRGGPEFLEWAGGYFEAYHSVNPFWEADFKELPKHPVATGVKPFKIKDEWYYHMRFPEGMKNVTPILTATPPDNTRGKPGANESHGGNPDVQKHMGEPEHVMWVIDRPDGGRGFGFTGGHWHSSWLNEDFRRVILNALLWIARADIPPGGASTVINEGDLKENLDPKGR